MQSVQQAGQPQPRKPARFRRALVGLGCGALFLILGYALTWEDKPKTPKAQAATAPVTATPATPAKFWAEVKENYEQPEPKAEEPAAAKTQMAPANEPAEPGTAGGKSAGTGGGTKAKKTEPGTGQVKTAQATKPPKPEPWLFASVKESKPPFQRPKPTPGSGEIEKTLSVLKPAPWVKPLDARRVLFPDQVIPAITEQALNSDEPGTLRFMVTQNVVDTQGGNHILIPQFTRGVSKMEGAVKDYQERVPLRVKSLRFPDGTFLPFDADVGDRSGANAVPGTVNRHLLEKGAAILGSAILSVGSRVPFGSPGTGQYQQNLPQEFSQDFANGINRAGQQVVGKALNRPNTIEQMAGYPITIQFVDPVSFQQQPLRTAR